jgi:hypothetical protein
MTEHTEAELLKAISDKTKEHWEAKQEPLLLSELGPFLLANGINFREIMSLPMKTFIEGKLHSDVKIIIHPDQPQKVGVLPIDVSYEFPPLRQQLQRTRDRDLKLLFREILSSTPSGSVPDRLIESSRPPEPTKSEQAVAAIQTLASRDGSSRKFVYRSDGASEEKIRAFLRLIDGLTFREIDAISIPLRILVRMLMT